VTLYVQVPLLPFQEEVHHKNKGLSNLQGKARLGRSKTLGSCSCSGMGCVSASPRRVDPPPENVQTQPNTCGNPYNITILIIVNYFLEFFN